MRGAHPSLPDPTRRMKPFDAFLFAVPACILLFAPTQEDSREIERGRYLAEQVAMCVQCHSPRDESGALIEGKSFTGGTIPFGSPWPSQAWGALAPHIAGLPGYTREDGLRLLEHGLTPSQRRPRPPMPAFRMSAADARAVVAYLKSLR